MVARCAIILHTPVLVTCVCERCRTVTCWVDSENTTLLSRLFSFFLTSYKKKFAENPMAQSRVYCTVTSTAFTSHANLEDGGVPRRHDSIYGTVWQIKESMAEERVGMGKESDGCTLERDWCTVYSQKKLLAYEIIYSSSLSFQKQHMWHSVGGEACASRLSGFEVEPYCTVPASMT